MIHLDKFERRSKLSTMATNANVELDKNTSITDESYWLTSFGWVGECSHLGIKLSEEASLCDGNEFHPLGKREWSHPRLLTMSVNIRSILADARPHFCSNAMFYEKLITPWLNRCRLSDTIKKIRLACIRPIFSQQLPAAQFSVTHIGDSEATMSFLYSGIFTPLQKYAKRAQFITTRMNKHVFVCVSWYNILYYIDEHEQKWVERRARLNWEQIVHLIAAFAQRAHSFARTVRIIDMRWKNNRSTCTRATCTASFHRHNITINRHHHHRRYTLTHSAPHY